MFSGHLLNHTQMIQKSTWALGFRSKYLFLDWRGRGAAFDFSAQLVCNLSQCQPRTVSSLIQILILGFPTDAKHVRTVGSDSNPSGSREASSWLGSELWPKSPWRRVPANSAWHIGAIPVSLSSRSWRGQPRPGRFCLAPRDGKVHGGAKVWTWRLVIRCCYLRCFQLGVLGLQMSHSLLGAGKVVVLHIFRHKVATSSITANRAVWGFTPHFWSNFWVEFCSLSVHALPYVYYIYMYIYIYMQMFSIALLCCCLTFFSHDFIPKSQWTGLRWQGIWIWSEVFVCKAGDEACSPMGTPPNLGRTMVVVIKNVDETGWIVTWYWHDAMWHDMIFQDIS